MHCGGYNSNKNYLIPKINNVCDLGTGDTKRTIEEVMDWLSKNPQHTHTLVTQTATAILGSSQINITHTSHHFHTHSRFMNSIYDLFKKTIKQDIELCVCLKINANKWNPSDIWISKKSQISAKIDSIVGVEQNAY